MASFSASFSNITETTARFTASFTGGDSSYSRKRYVRLVIDGTEWEITSSNTGGSNSSFSKTISGFLPGTEYYWYAELGYIANGVLIWTDYCDDGYFTTEEELVEQTWSVSSTTYEDISSIYTTDVSLSSYTIKRISISFENSGTATFYTSGSYDTLGYFSTSSGFDEYEGEPTSYIEKNDDGGSGSNFEIVVDVDARRTYYLWIRFYSGETTGSVSLTIEPPEQIDIGRATGFSSLYVSSSTIHGYVQKVTGATSYRIYYRPNNTTTATTITSNDGYFHITGLTPGQVYVLNYRGVNGSYTGDTMTTPIEEITVNDRSWTLFEGNSWGMLESNDYKEVTYLLDDYYLYRYPISFSGSGTVTIEVRSPETNFNALVYFSTSPSYSDGLPTNYIMCDNGTSFSITANIKANTPYYIWFRPNNGGNYIGRIRISAYTSALEEPTGLGCVYIYSGGWKKSIPYVYSGGTWKPVTANVYSGGWKETIG